MTIGVLVSHDVDEGYILHIQDGVGPQCHVEFLSKSGHLVAGWVPMWADDLRTLLADRARTASDSMAATVGWDG